MVGGRGSGKTDFVKNLIYPLTKKRYICDTFDNPAWRTYKTHLHPERSGEIIPIIDLEDVIEDATEGTETFRIANSDTDAIFDTIEKDVWNALVVVEDATRFISRQVSSEVRKFVLDTKQRNLDLIFVFHSLTDVPPDLIRWSDYLTLFKTNEAWNSTLRNKFPHQGIERTFHKVRSLPQYSNLTINIGG